MWDAQQREYLQAMGLRVERWLGEGADTAERTHAATQPSERLLSQLLRAGRLQDAAVLPVFPATWDGAGKRSYWRQLRALRVGMR